MANTGHKIRGSPTGQSTRGVKRSTLRHRSGRLSSGEDALFPLMAFMSGDRSVDLGGTKVPFAIGMKDDSPFVFAGLWEGWKDLSIGPMVSHLHHHYWRPERTGGPASYQDACNPPCGTPCRMAR